MPLERSPITTTNSNYSNNYNNNETGITNGVIRVVRHGSTRGMSPITVKDETDKKTGGLPGDKWIIRTESPVGTRVETSTLNRDPVVTINCNGSLPAVSGDCQARPGNTGLISVMVHSTGSGRQPTSRSSSPVKVSVSSSPPPRPKDPPLNRLISSGQRRTPPPRPPCIRSPNLRTTVKEREVVTSDRTDEIGQSTYPLRSGGHHRAVIYPAPTWMTRSQGRQDNVASPTGQAQSPRQTPQPQPSRGERDVTAVDCRRGKVGDTNFRRYASLPPARVQRSNQRFVIVVRDSEDSTTGSTLRKLPVTPGAYRPVRIYRTVENTEGRQIEIVREPRVRVQGVSRNTLQGPLRSPQPHRTSSLPPSTSPVIIPITKLSSPPPPTGEHLSNYGYPPYATVGRRNTYQPVLGKSNSSAPSSPMSLRSPGRQRSPQGLPPLHPARTVNRAIVINQTSPNELIPLGPAEEKVDERLVPDTGEVQRVTTRTQSFTDVTGTMRVNEVVEKAEGDQTMETHLWRRTTKSPMNASPEVSRAQTVRFGIGDQRGHQNASVRSGRTASQTHISSQQPMPANRYASETNLLTTVTHRQQTQPFHTNYSAHRENQRRLEEERRKAENWKMSNQQIVDNRSVGGAQELTEEMETIALQPIGKGIHDLEPSMDTLMRHNRAMTPTPGYNANVDTMENYRTLGSMATTANWTRDGAMSRDQVFYPPDARSSLARYVSTYEGQVQTGQIPQAGLFLDNVDSKLLSQVTASSRYWYMPNISRADVSAMLRDKEPGSFIIRTSQSFRNHFSLGLKIPHDAPGFLLKPSDASSGYIRYYLISPVPLPDGRGNGLFFNGFANTPTFSSLVTLVAHHLINPRHLPCPLRLPDGMTVGYGDSHTNSVHNVSSVHTAMNYNSVPDHPSYLSGEAFTAPMLFLGSVEIGPNIGADSVENGITRLLSQPSSLEKREVYVKLVPREGMKLVDRDGTLVKKAVKAEHIAWVGMDPRGRDFNDPELNARGMYNAKIFAVVVKKPITIMTKRNIYAFCELTPNQSAFSLVHYMKGIYPNH